MAAYFIVDVQITHPTEYEEYRRQVLPTIERYGGRFLARGGQTWTLEGDWQPGRLVIVEFESVERAREWYGSPEYAPLLKLRHAASESRMILVQGV